MAIYYAQGSGNLTEVTWNSAVDGSGSTVAWASQQVTDVLDANGYTIVINADAWTRAAITTKSTTGGASGGFTVAIDSAARNFAANIGDDTRDSLSTVLTTVANGYALTITGNVYGGDDAALGLNPVSMKAALLKIVGHVYGGNKGTCLGIGRMGNAGTLEVTGNITASAGPAIQAGYRQTITIGGDAVAADGVVAVQAYSDYYTALLGGAAICSADGTWPFGTTSAGMKLKMTGTATGEGVKVRDGSLAEKTLYLPDYPAEADVKHSVTYDYSTKTGTYDPTAAAVYPAAADVWHDTGAYGPTGSDYTPAMVGSDIANLEAGNIKKDVVIDDVTGSYEGAGGGGGPLVGASALVSC